MSFVFKSLKFPENVGSDQVPNYVRFVPKIIKYGGTQSLRAGTNAVGAPSLGGGGLGGIAQSSIVPGLGGIAENLNAARKCSRCSTRRC